MSRLTSALLLFALVLPFPSLHAQSASPAAAALDKARKLSMPHQEDTPSFHLRATFQTFDQKGQPDGTGVIEESYREPGRWKRAITYRGQTRVAVYDTRLHTHSDPLFEDSFAVGELLDALWAPAPSSSGLPKTDGLEMTPTTVSGLQLSCILLKLPRADEQNSQAMAPNKAYCITPDTGLLRVTEGHSRSFIGYNRFLHMGPRVLAGDVTVVELGVKRAELHVTDFSAVPDMPSSQVALPVDATGQPLSEDREPFRGDVMKNLLHHDRPTYTNEMAMRHMEGNVVVMMLIGRDGHVHDTRLLQTPDERMIEPAMDAARSYVFKPIIIDGSAVEFRFTLNIGFRMH